MVLNPVPFAANQAALGAEAQSVVERTVECLDEHRRILLLEIRGGKAPGERPLDLGEQRARAVYDALIASGVDPRRLRAAGAGEPRKAASEPRSVDFVILRTLTCDADRG